MAIDYNRRIQDEDTTIGTPSGIVSTSTSQTNPSTQSSGQFSNLQDYVNANAGERNSTANRVGQDITNKYNTALSGVTGAVGGVAQNKTALDTQRGNFNTVVSGAGVTGSAITPEQIASARNMAMGVTTPGVEQRQQANNLVTQAEATKQLKANELRNIGSGTYNIQDYLRGVRANPASSTGGELRLDEFLTKQTPEGSTKLQDAATKGASLASNTQLQDAMGQVEASYGNLNPTTLSDYVKQNRATYQTGLGPINKARASTIAMQNRGITDQNAARSLYESSVGAAKANDQNIKDYETAIEQAYGNINSYNNQISQADQYAGTGNEAKLDELLKLNNIATPETDAWDPRYGTKATAMRNDLVKGLQSLRTQRASDVESRRQAIRARQDEVTSGIQAVNPYYQYTQDVARAKTRENALRSSEMARLQALYSIAGDDQDYRNYLAGGL